MGMVKGDAAMENFDLKEFITTTTTGKINAAARAISSKKATVLSTFLFNQLSTSFLRVRRS